LLRGGADRIRALSADQKLGHDCIVVAPSLIPKCHEALRDLSRAREATRKDLKGKRQQVSSFMLRLGRHYPGKKTWGRAHMNWLLLQQLAHREQRIVLAICKLIPSAPTDCAEIPGAKRCPCLLWNCSAARITRHLVYCRR
jgi:hypothetical protein